MKLVVIIDVKKVKHQNKSGVFQILLRSQTGAFRLVIFLIATKQADFESLCIYCRKSTLPAAGWSVMYVLTSRPPLWWIWGPSTLATHS